MSRERVAAREHWQSFGIQDWVADEEQSYDERIGIPDESEDLEYVPIEHLQPNETYTHLRHISEYLWSATHYDGRLE